MRRTAMRAWYWMIDPEEINYIKVVQIGKYKMDLKETRWDFDDRVYLNQTNKK
jgi:hypothetical protein